MQTDQCRRRVTAPAQTAQPSCRLVLPRRRVTFSAPGTGPTRQASSPSTARGAPSPPSPGRKLGARDRDKTASIPPERDEGAAEGCRRGELRDGKTRRRRSSRFRKGVRWPGRMKTCSRNMLNRRHGIMRSPPIPFAEATGMPGPGSRIASPPKKDLFIVAGDDRRSRLAGGDELKWASTVNYLLEEFPPRSTPRRSRSALRRVRGSRHRWPCATSRSADAASASCAAPHRHFAELLRSSWPPRWAPGGVDLPRAGAT